MKTIRIESSAEINLKGEKGAVKVIFEIPYPESIFKDQTEELNDWLDSGKKVLQNMGIKASQKEEIFVHIEREVYGPVAEQIANYISATLTTGISSMEILSLLQLHLEQARIEAIKIVEKNSENAEKWS